METLEGYAPQRILSSSAVRCLETMAPLAERLQLKVEKEEALAEGAGLAALALVRRVANEKIALCTHGDVIPEILVVAGRRGPPRPRAPTPAGERIGLGARGRGRPVRQGRLPAPGRLGGTARRLSRRADLRQI